VFAAYRALFRAGGGIDEARLGEIVAPVLCVAGTRDHLCQGTRKLAETIPGATMQLLPGESHLSAIGAPLFRESLLRFFASV
jgi:pimeloyl-ACP methyl ester carboxylesterase